VAAEEAIDRVACQLAVTAATSALTAAPAAMRWWGDGWETLVNSGFTKKKTLTLFSR